MLTVLGRSHKFCDGVSRRSFLKIGAFAFGADAVHPRRRPPRRADAAARPSHKAVINIFLGGGPPHQDMWEIKTEAPAEIRGEFKPIATKVPGIQIGEVLPADRRAAWTSSPFIRSVVGARGGHDADPVHDRLAAAVARGDGRPAEHRRASLSKLHGPVDPSVPPFVGLAEPDAARAVDRLRAGRASSAPPTPPFKPDGDGMAEHEAQRHQPVDQLADRKQLLASFDGLRARARRRRRDARASTPPTERALGVLTSSKLVEALDLSQGAAEGPRAATATASRTSSSTTAPRPCNDQLLMARRLVEAGVRCVTLTYGRWDSHGKNFDLVRDHGAQARPVPHARWSKTWTRAACSTT